jgi:hypothetical protein
MLRVIGQTFSSMWLFGSERSLFDDLEGVAQFFKIHNHNIERIMK